MTFSERKEARKAAQGQCRFVVRYNGYRCGFDLAEFGSRKMALEFAYGQIGRLSGNTPAIQAAYAGIKKESPLSAEIVQIMDIVVERVSPAGERVVVRMP